MKTFVERCLNDEKATALPKQKNSASIFNNSNILERVFSLMQSQRTKKDSR